MNDRENEISDVRPGAGSAVSESPKTVSQQGAPGAATVNHNTTEHSKLTPWLVIICLLAGAALMGMFWAMTEAHRAETKAEVATMRVEGLTRALIAHGVKDTYPHLPGEDD
jgi:hypothetical protein